MCDSLVWTCWSVFQLFSCEVSRGGGGGVIPLCGLVGRCSQLFSCEVSRGGGVIPLCGLVGRCSSYFLVRCLMVGV